MDDRTPPLAAQPPSGLDGSAASRWLRRRLSLVKHLPEHVVPTGGALVITFLITGGLGFLFWLVAAHYFPTGEVGFAAATVAAMMFLAICSMVGLGTMMMGESARYPGREIPLIGTGVLVTGLLGTAVGLLFAVVISQVSVSFRYLAFPQNALAFAFGTGLTTAVLVLDQSLVGLLERRALVIRGVTFSGVKLVAVLAAGPWFGDHTGMLIFATWVLGDVVSLILLGVIAARRRQLAVWAPTEWRLVRELLPHAPGHHLMNVGLLAPSWATPVLVAVLLSPELNASFYVAQMITAPGLYIPGALAFSLFAVAVRGPGHLTHQIRTTVALSFAAAAAAAVGVVLLGRLVLGWFGEQYVIDGGTTLVILTLLMFPLTIKVHFANLRRIEGRTINGASYVLAGGVLELVGAAIGAQLGGIDGVALGVLVAIAIEALVMGPTVFRALRGSPRQPGRAADAP